jgi:hypothetical protein
VLTTEQRVIRSARWFGDAWAAMAQLDPHDSPEYASALARRVVRASLSWEHWHREAIIAAKGGPCRVCEFLHGDHDTPRDVEYHHLVSREDGGDDIADNIVPVCQFHHHDITRRDHPCGTILLRSLSDAEYAYMVERGGEDYPERAYGITYQRGGAT